MKLSRIAIAAALTIPTTAVADEDISAVQTSYVGAIILEGDVDVSFDDLSTGEYGDDDDSTYGFFTGNTLYAGTSDDAGNMVDAIVEFFWFESSIDRGSDFYVAVIKARTTPGESYELDTCTSWINCGEPALSVYADTDLTAANGAFRWDWSVPFQDYGIDAYGQVTLTNSYGLGAGAEGSAMYKQGYDEDGVAIDGNVQSKGYVSTEYRVETQYEVTLYEWEVEVNGNAGSMYWDVTMNRGDTADESAYHEYFLVMQVTEGEIFTLDSLQVIGNVDKGPSEAHRTLGLSIDGLMLTAPAYEPEEDETEDDDDDDWGWDTGWDWDDDEEETESDDSDDDASGGDDDMGDAELTSRREADQEGDTHVSMCSAIPLASAGFWAALISLFGVSRRRRS